MVPFYNSKNSLPSLINALLIQDYPKKMLEIVMVDDGSTDESYDIANKLLGNIPVSEINVKILRCGKKGGPAKARNYGIRNSKGEIIALTDSDTIPDEKWVCQLVKCFQKSNDIGGVQGKTITESERFIFPLRVAPISRFVTCNIAYRKEVLLKCQLFDERYQYPFREDSDLAYKVLEKGYKIISTENAIVYHPLRTIKITDISRNTVYHMYDVLLYKDHSMLARDDLGAPIVGGFTLSGIAFFGYLIALLLPITFLYYPLYLLYFSLLVVFVLALIMIKKAKYKAVPMSERMLSSVWHLLYFISAEVGRIIGCFKFKKIYI